MKRYALCLAVLIVVLSSTSVLAQGYLVHPKKHAKDVFVFVGAVRDIHGDNVTIDVAKVKERGGGDVKFAESQWTFVVRDKVKITRSKVVILLTDVQVGDRVVIVARKRSERAYDLMRLNVMPPKRARSHGWRQGGRRGNGGNWNQGNGQKHRNGNWGQGGNGPKHPSGGWHKNGKAGGHHHGNAGHKNHIKKHRKNKGAPYAPTSPEQEAPKIK